MAYGYYFYYTKSHLSLGRWSSLLHNRPCPYIHRQPINLTWNRPIKVKCFLTSPIISDNYNNNNNNNMLLAFVPNFKFKFKLASKLTFAWKLILAEAQISHLKGLLCLKQSLPNEIFILHFPQHSRTYPLMRECVGTNDDWETSLSFVESAFMYSQSFECFKLSTSWFARAHSTIGPSLKSSLFLRNFAIFQGPALADMWQLLR